MSAWCNVCRTTHLTGCGYVEINGEIIDMRVLESRDLVRYRQDNTFRSLVDGLMAAVLYHQYSDNDFRAAMNLAHKLAEQEKERLELRRLST